MTVQSFSDANVQIMQAYGAAASAAPDPAILDGVVGTPIAPELVSQFLEYVYANRAAMPPSVVAAAIDVGNFATANGFYGLGDDQRGFKMIKVLKGQTVTGAPDPKAQYVAAPAEPTPPAA